VGRELPVSYIILIEKHCLWAPGVHGGHYVLRKSVMKWNSTCWKVTLYQHMTHFKREWFSGSSGQQISAHSYPWYINCFLYCHMTEFDPTHTTVLKVSSSDLVFKVGKNYLWLNTHTEPTKHSSRVWINPVHIKKEFGKHGFSFTLCRMSWTLIS
jgi:hypothetical protein